MSVLQERPRNWRDENVQDHDVNICKSYFGSLRHVDKNLHLIFLVLDQSLEAFFCDLVWPDDFRDHTTWLQFTTMHCINDCLKVAINVRDN